MNTRIQNISIGNVFNVFLFSCIIKRVGEYFLIIDEKQRRGYRSEKEGRTGIMGRIRSFFIKEVSKYKYKSRRAIVLLFYDYLCE